MFKQLVKKALEKMTPPAKPGNATLKPMKYNATITVRRKDGSLKSKREIENGKEIFKEDY